MQYAQILATDWSRERRSIGNGKAAAFRFEYWYMDFILALEKCTGHIWDLNLKISVPCERCEEITYLIAECGSS